MTPFAEAPSDRAPVVTDALPLTEDQTMHQPASPARRLAVALSGGSRTIATVAVERDLALRLSRVRAQTADLVAQRRRPSRPRVRALVLRSPGRLQWRSVPAPPPPTSAGALVRPLAMATCDLDRPLALGRTAFPTPLQLGHECVAEVLSVGDDVSRVAVGDRVVVPFQVSCGRCVACRRGLTGNCRSVPPLSMFGFGLAGGLWGGVMSERVAVPFADAMLVPLPPGVDPTLAASSADTLSDAYRHVGPYVEEVRAHPDGPAVIAIGAIDRSSPFSASMPLFVGLLTRALLPEARFLLIDERPWVRDRAERLGLDAGPGNRLRGLRAPLVVDASASPRGLRLALTAVAPDGRCSCAGNLHAWTRIPATLMFGRNVTLTVARSHIQQVIPRVLDLLAADRLQPAGVITQLGHLDDAVELLDAHLRSRDIKTVLVA